MNTTHLQLISSMIEYYRGDAKRIQHFIKVYNFASLLGRQEQLDEETLFILETAAIVHDIGIRICEQKYGICDGKHQEPLLLGNLLQQTYSIVDAVIVGKFLGINSLAAVGAGTSVITLILGFCTGCCCGFGIPMAQKFGAHDYLTLRR